VQKSLELNETAVLKRSETIYSSLGTTLKQKNHHSLEISRDISYPKVFILDQNLPFCWLKKHQEHFLRSNETIILFNTCFTAYIIVFIWSSPNKNNPKS